MPAARNLDLSPGSDVTTYDIMSLPPTSPWNDVPCAVTINANGDVGYLPPNHPCGDDQFMNMKSSCRSDNGEMIPRSLPFLMHDASSHVSTVEIACNGLTSCERLFCDEKSVLGTSRLCARTASLSLSYIDSESASALKLLKPELQSRMNVVDHLSRSRSASSTIDESPCTANVDLVVPVNNCVSDLNGWNRTTSCSNMGNFPGPFQNGAFADSDEDDPCDGRLVIDVRETDPEDSSDCDVGPDIKEKMKTDMREHDNTDVGAVQVKQVTDAGSLSVTAVDLIQDQPTDEKQEIGKLDLLNSDGDGCGSETLHKHIVDPIDHIKSDHEDCVKMDDAKDTVPEGSVDSDGQKTVKSELQVEDDQSSGSNKVKSTDDCSTSHDTKLRSAGVCRLSSGNVKRKKSDIQEQSLSRIKQESFLSSEMLTVWPSDLKRRVGAGLHNLGNTCFVNATIQCLSYTVPLINYLFKYNHSDSCSVNGMCLMCELEQHIRHCFENGGSIIRPQSILQKLKVIARHMRWGRQEDAHEFLRYMVEAMHKSCISGHQLLPDKCAKDSSVVNEIFGGYLRSQVTCLRCHAKSNTFDPFLDISLDVKNVSSIIRALERFVEPETLDTENAYNCTKCRCKVRAQKRFTLHKLPHVLTIQLKRYGMMGGKVTRHIVFPEVLDVRPYISPNHHIPADKVPDAEYKYRLYGVLVHEGHSTSSGHYYCYVLTAGGTWYCLNDHIVRRSSLSQVLAAEAYLLFYNRGGTATAHHDDSTDVSDTADTGDVMHSLASESEFDDAMLQLASTRSTRRKTLSYRSSLLKAEDRLHMTESSERRKSACLGGQLIIPHSSHKTLSSVCRGGRMKSSSVVAVEIARRLRNSCKKASAVLRSGCKSSVSTAASSGKTPASSPSETVSLKENKTVETAAETSAKGHKKSSALSFGKVDFDQCRKDRTLSGTAFQSRSCSPPHSQTELIETSKNPKSLPSSSNNGNAGLTVVDNKSAMNCCEKITHPMCRKGRNATCSNTPSESCSSADGSKSDVVCESSKNQKKDRNTVGARTPSQSALPNSGSKFKPGAENLKNRKKTKERKSTGSVIVPEPCLPDNNSRAEVCSENPKNRKKAAAVRSTVNDNEDAKSQCEKTVHVVDRKVRSCPAATTTSPEPCLAIKGCKAEISNEGSKNRKKTLSSSNSDNARCTADNSESHKQVSSTLPDTALPYGEEMKAHVPSCGDVGITRCRRKTLTVPLCTNLDMQDKTARSPTSQIGSLMETSKGEVIGSGAKCAKRTNSVPTSASTVVPDDNKAQCSNDLPTPAASQAQSVFSTDCDKVKKHSKKAQMADKSRISPTTTVAATNSDQKENSKSVFASGVLTKNNKKKPAAKLSKTVPTPCSSHMSTHLKTDPSKESSKVSDRKTEGEKAVDVNPALPKEVKDTSDDEKAKVQPLPRIILKICQGRVVDPLLDTSCSSGPSTCQGKTSIKSQSASCASEKKPAVPKLERQTSSGSQHTIHGDDVEETVKGHCHDKNSIPAEKPEGNGGIVDAHSETSVNCDSSRDLLSGNDSSKTAVSSVAYDKLSQDYWDKLSKLCADMDGQAKKRNQDLLPKSPEKLHAARPSVAHNANNSVFKKASCKSTSKQIVTGSTNCRVPSNDDDIELSGAASKSLPAAGHLAKLTNVDGRQGPKPSAEYAKARLLSGYIRSKPSDPIPSKPSQFPRSNVYDFDVEGDEVDDSSCSVTLALRRPSSAARGDIGAPRATVDVPGAYGPLSRPIRSFCKKSHASLPQKELNSTAKSELADVVHCTRDVPQKSPAVATTADATSLSRSNIGSDYLSPKFSPDGGSSIHKPKVLRDRSTASTYNLSSTFDDTVLRKPANQADAKNEPGVDVDKKISKAPMKPTTDSDSSDMPPILKRKEDLNKPFRDRYSSDISCMPKEFGVPKKRKQLEGEPGICGKKGTYSSKKSRLSEPLSPENVSCTVPTTGTSCAKMKEDKCSPPVHLSDIGSKPLRKSLSSLHPASALVNDGTEGLLLPDRGNFESMSAAVQTGLTESLSAKPYSESSRKRVRGCSVASVVDETADLASPSSDRMSVQNLEEGCSTAPIRLKIRRVLDAEPGHEVYNIVRKDTSPLGAQHADGKSDRSAISRW